MSVHEVYRYNGRSPVHKAVVLRGKMPLIVILVPSLLRVLLGCRGGGGRGAEGEGSLVEGDTRALICGRLLQEPQKGGVHLPRLLQLRGAR